MSTCNGCPTSECGSADRALRLLNLQSAPSTWLTRSMTGGRIKRVRSHLGNETFCLTYGDGVSDVNVKELIAFSKKNAGRLNYASGGTGSLT